MQNYADISVFENLCSPNNGVRNMGVLNESVIVWSSPSIGYDVIQRDDNVFELQCNIQGAESYLVDEYETAKEAIEEAKLLMYGDSVDVIIE